MENWRQERINPEEYDLAMGFDYIDHPNYIRVPLYYTFYTNKVSTEFDSGDDLVEYVKKVDSDDDLYCDIWNQKMITDPAKAYKAIKARVS